MIKFITEAETKNETVTLEQVSIDQFFVNSDGYLCQKVLTDTYLVIANAGGEPHSSVRDECEEDEVIKRILPRIKKIEF